MSLTCSDHNSFPCSGMPDDDGRAHEGVIDFRLKGVRRLDRSKEDREQQRGSKRSRHACKCNIKVDEERRAKV